MIRYRATSDDPVMTWPGAVQGAKLLALHSDLGDRNLAQQNSVIHVVSCAAGSCLTGARQRNAAQLSREQNSSAEEHY